MTAEAAPFEMTQGETRILEVTVYDEVGAIVNLLGATARFGFANAGKPWTTIESKTIGDGITVIDATNGVLQVKLDDVDTQGRHGKYVFELDMTDAQSNVSTILVGEFTIKKGLV